MWHEKVLVDDFTAHTICTDCTDTGLHNNNNNNNNNIFVPVAIESAGTWNHQAVQELGRPMTAVTEDTREATHLFQRMSVALHLQRGNAVSFHSTFTTE